MKTFVSITICLFLLGGCASHGTWSKSDRGAWANLDEVIGTHNKNYYVEQWGSPVSRRYTKPSDESGNVPTNGEELLWLWRADGIGPSDQPGQGWELFIEFNTQGTFRNWRVGAYRTTLTVSDVIAASRKFHYRLDDDLLRELGLSKEQHGIEELDQWAFGENRNSREHEIEAMRLAVLTLTAATFVADITARDLHDQLATENDVIKIATRESADATPERRTRSSTNYGSGGVGGGFLGGSFLGPYTPNAYGPGMNADATGRPFVWRPDFGGPALGSITPNAYGPGVGMDATGRPVRPTCPPGWAGPC